MILTCMPRQFDKVYRKTGSFLFAYRSKALPKNCLDTLGDRWQWPPWPAAAPDAAEAELMPSDAPKPSVRTAAAPMRVAQLILVRDLRLIMKPPACRSVPVLEGRDSLGKLFTLTRAKSSPLEEKVLKLFKRLL